MNGLCSVRTFIHRKEWLQYAIWEVCHLLPIVSNNCHLTILPYGQASQNKFARSRSIFEQALDIDPRSNQLWLSYTEMELKSRNVQHARNLFDRAVPLLHRVDQLWYKYVYLEELLQNVPGARQVFERWMKWEPDDKAWQAYIKLEVRNFHMTDEIMMHGLIMLDLRKERSHFPLNYHHHGHQPVINRGFALVHSSYK